MSQEQLLQIITSAMAKCPAYDPKFNYMLELRKGAIINQALQDQISRCTHEIEEFNRQLNGSTKKQRRKASQIQKQFQCHHCQKQYGSEASLHLHQKIKHSQSDSESKTARGSPVI